MKPLPPSSVTSNIRFARNVLLKASILFVLANLFFGLAWPLAALGKVSAYNHLFPGRKRLPYGDNPERAYNLSLYNLEAMFASHELAAGDKPPDEFRVLFIGDSSTWGYLLLPEQTLTEVINQKDLRLKDGRKLRAYNLGYPVMSLMKDLLILSYAKRYQPDLIVWPVTLESFPYDKQLFSPLLQNNPQAVQELIETNQLSLNIEESGIVEPGAFDRTILGARRSLADLVRLQLYGVLWAATGIDQDIPQTYTPRQEDLAADETFHDLEPPQLEDKDLAFETLEAGVKLAGKTPILIINEPMFISQGKNSGIRYNFYYPRWAYDAYRDKLARLSLQKGWRYLDLWDAVPASEFTNSAVHMTPYGTRIFASQIEQAILDLAQTLPAN
jgi:hypothetical protein